MGKEKDITFKGALFGGYQKGEVDRYIKKLLEENEKEQEALKEQIAFLLNENKELKIKGLDTGPYMAAALEKEQEDDEKITMRFPLPYTQEQISKLDELEAKLMEATKNLEKEKYAKGMLRAKLEYSNKVLIQLYKMRGIHSFFKRK